MRHEACNIAPTVGCVCGLAVQEGNEVIVLEKCKGKNLEKGHKTTASDGRLSDGMQLKTVRSGKEYTVRWSPELHSLKTQSQGVIN